MIFFFQFLAKTKRHVCGLYSHFISHFLLSIAAQSSLLFSHCVSYSLHSLHHNVVIRLPPPPFHLPYCICPTIPRRPAVCLSLSRKEKDGLQQQRIIKFIWNFACLISRLSRHKMPSDEFHFISFPRIINHFGPVGRVSKPPTPLHKNLFCSLPLSSGPLPLLC